MILIVVLGLTSVVVTTLAICKVAGDSDDLIEKINTKNEILHKNEKQ